MNSYNCASDEHLVLAISRKQSGAMTELYNRYARQMRTLIQRSLKNVQNTEDVLQEVFMHIWKFASSYQPKLGTASTWIRKIAHNRVIDLLRSRRYKQSVAEAVRFDYDAGKDQALVSRYAVNTTWQETVLREYESNITRAMEILPESQRALVQLAFMHGYSHQEVSNETGIPLGTVKTRIRSGIQALKTHLNYYSEDFA